MSESDNIRQSAKTLLKKLSAYCSSYSLSEDGLREIIERHGFTTTNNNLNISDYDFFFRACENEKVNEGVIRCLLEYFPDAASAVDNGWSPLHFACYNKNVTLRIVQLLIDAAPNSISRVNNDGWMPLHMLCKNKKVDKTTAEKTSMLLAERHHQAVRHADNLGFLPLHYACGSKSPEFCRVLIEAYAGSARINDRDGLLPLHYACFMNNVATVEYLYKLHPDAITHVTKAGFYPTHNAIIGVRHRNNPRPAVDIVQFLLDCDPDVKLQKVRGRLSLLHVACEREYNDTNIEAGIQVIKVIYDAYPEAIECDEISSGIHHYHQQVQTFLNSQLVYSRQAKDHRLMMTPNEKGQLPLHTALQNSASLGSIKLLVKQHPSGIRIRDNNLALPLHLACQHHESAGVVEYLLGLDATTLRAVDFDNNTALHYACRGAKHDTIALLLEKYGAVSVSKCNDHKKLPIDLLWESDRVEDRASVEYTESIFRLLKEYPETVMNIGIQKQYCDLAACPSQNGKKRKFGLSVLLFIGGMLWLAY